MGILKNIMTSKIEKFLRKLNSRRRKILGGTLLRMTRGNFEGLHVKKLEGFANRYRVRKGDIRIKYSLDKNNKAAEIEIEWRGDTTY